MTFIKKHWRGEFSLARSFWLNVFLLNVGLSVLDIWLAEAHPIENPVVASQVTLVYVFITLVLIYPWQIVGLWRSASKHSELAKRTFWARTVKLLVVLSVVGSIGNLSFSWPVYKHLYQIGFGVDPYGEYRVELTADRELIHLQGGLGFGVAKDVERLLAKQPSVSGIILDSHGGRVVEGRNLAKIILDNGLTTYSLNGCYSACTTAFIAGDKRYLAKGANLAFHQYKSDLKNLNILVDLSFEQKKDLAFYKRQGVAQAFIDRVFKAEKDDLWYPTTDEMINSGVVHKVVSSSTLRPIKYTAIKTSALAEELKAIAVFQSIEKYEPDLYQHIIKSMEAHIQKGASVLETQQEVGAYIQLLAGRALPTTSNKALVRFADETVKLMKKLDAKDPILCIKFLFPEQYGSLDITQYFPSNEMMPMMSAFDLVIIDSYGAENDEIDRAAAQRLVSEIVTELGAAAAYMEATKLQNRAEYSRTCKSFIHFYEAMLSNTEQAAGNGLRYVFTP